MVTVLKDIKPPEKKVYTVEDYRALPEGTPYQLIKGELVMTPSPTTRHQRILKRLLNLLYEMERKGLGEALNAPIDVYIGGDVYQPDIIFISKDRLEIIKDDGIHGAPDIVIEILSPSTAYYDLRPKKDTYESSGVKEYWIVDPIRRSIEIYENREKRFEIITSPEGKGKVESKVIKGFSVEIEGLFS